MTIKRRLMLLAGWLLAWILSELLMVAVIVLLPVQWAVKTLGRAKRQ